MQEKQAQSGNGSGTLFMVATPIGNIGDFSPRARQTLESCDLVLAEDTRRTLALCRECKLELRRVESFHDHNEREKEALVVERLLAGEDVALVSDAGTPLVADPGFRLVRRARSLGIRVRPVPGPSAPVAALSAAGIAPLPYTFLGFLPREEGAIKKLFQAFAKVQTSLLFFERKDRLEGSLALARDILGEREAAVCRELTKEHEEFILFALQNEGQTPKDLLGEITVVIGPPSGRGRTDEQQARSVLSQELQKGLKPKAAARNAQERLEGWSVKELYAMATAKEDA